MKILKGFIFAAFLLSLASACAENEKKWQPSLQYMFEIRDDWKYWVATLNTCIVNIEFAADRRGSRHLTESQNDIHKENYKKNAAKYEELYKALYRTLNIRGLAARTLDDTKTTSKELANSQGLQNDVLADCINGLPKLLFPKVDFFEAFKPES